MITVTFIFGSDAVAKYDNTNKVPSRKWINKNGGDVLKRTFYSDAELNAYFQALNDYDGWLEYSNTTPVKTPIKIRAHKIK